MRILKNLLVRRPNWPAGCNLAGAMLGLALTAGPLAAATNRVLMVGTQFEPRLLTNQVGDYVVWTNTSTLPHNVVSSNGAWTATAAAPSPYTFVNHFTSPGVYGYYCQIHLSFGMTGIIYVEGAPNQPPVVTLTNPPNGLTLAAPASLTLGADASDPDGTVTNVQFYSGTTLLGSATTSPYSWAVPSLAAGNYSFTAHAFDNGGLVTTSAVVNVSVVTPGVIRFADTALTPVNGQFPLSLSVTPGLKYEIDWSRTFTNWFALTDFVAASATMNFTTPATGGYRFFKAFLLPNP